MDAPATSSGAAAALSGSARPRHNALGLLIRLALCLAIWSACYLYGRYEDSRAPDWQSLSALAAAAVAQLAVSVWSWRQQPFPKAREQLATYVAGKAVVVIGALAGLLLCVAMLVAGAFDHYQTQDYSRTHHALPLPAKR